MHGVGRKQKCVRARRREPLRSFDNQAISAFEVIGPVKGGIVIEVEAFDHQPGAVQTAERIVRDRKQRIALLGTRFTMTEQFAREPYEQQGIVVHELAADWRAEVDRIIYEELAYGRVVRDSQRTLKTLITDLAQQKVQAIVLGCTELVLAVDTRANVLPVYDTTAIHARAAAEWMLAEEVEAEAKAAA